MVYIIFNGVYMDFVVLVKNELQDWGSYFYFFDEFRCDIICNWIVIGWGDKNFFLKMKSWGDLIVGMVLKVVFGLGIGVVYLVQCGELDFIFQDVFVLQFNWL